MAFRRERGIATNLRHRLSLELKTSRRWHSDAGSRRPPGWHDDAKSLNEKRTLIYQKAVFLPCSYANCGKNASDGERVGRITTGDIAFIFLRRTLGADSNPVETKTRSSGFWKKTCALFLPARPLRYSLEQRHGHPYAVAH
jgi:hypothetical protein